MNDQLVVYTVLVGDGFALPDTVPSAGVEYVCFTDNPDLPSNGWTLKQISPLFPSDLIRSSREPKIRPHRCLQDYSRSLYIDTRVQLTDNPNLIWNELISSSDVSFGGFYHSFRDSVAVEFVSVRDLNLDDPGRVKELQAMYETHRPKILKQRPVWGGMLARRHNAVECIEAMEIWWAHVLRYSRRDQLSLVLALASMPPETMNILTGDNHKGDHFYWPTTTARPERYFDHGSSAGPMQSIRRALKNFEKTYLRPVLKGGKLKLRK